MDDDSPTVEIGGGALAAVGGGIITIGTLAVSSNYRDEYQICNTVLGQLRDNGTSASCAAVNFFYDFRPVFLILGILTLLGGVGRMLLPTLRRAGLLTDAAAPDAASPDAAPPDAASPDAASPRAAADGRDPLRDTLTDLPPVHPDDPDPRQ
jgi:hypothetical protein